MSALLYIPIAFGAASLLGMWLVCRFTTPPKVAEPDPYAKIADDIRRQQDRMREKFGAPRPRLGADEVLRRHLHVNRKDPKRVAPRTET